MPIANRTIADAGNGQSAFAANAHQLNGTAAAMASSPPLQGDSVRIYNTRFQNLEQVATLKAGSAQLILTDPPSCRTTATGSASGTTSPPSPPGCWRWAVCSLLTRANTTSAM
jgi:hypothetical protein